MLFFIISNLKSAKTYKSRRVEQHVKQFILASDESYCNFQISFIYILHYALHCVLPYCIFHASLSFLLIVGAVYSSHSSLFRKMSIIGQLQVQTATAENEKQYTLSNIIYIAFQNFYSVL